jgi:hypothetical protein
MRDLNGVKDKVIPKQILQYDRLCWSTLELDINLRIKYIYLCLALSQIAEILPYVFPHLRNHSFIYGCWFQLPYHNRK